MQLFHTLKCYVIHIHLLPPSSLTASVIPKILVKVVLCFVYVITILFFYHKTMSSCNNLTLIMIFILVSFVFLIDFPSASTLGVSVSFLIFCILFSTIILPMLLLFLSLNDNIEYVLLHFFKHMIPFHASEVNDFFFLSTYYNCILFLFR